MARRRGQRRELISFEWGADSLITAFERMPRETKAAVEGVIKATTDRAFKIIKNRTPIGKSSKAFRGWKQQVRGSSGRVFNDVDYINVLEFGPYPVTPAKRTKRQGLRRGRAILGGAPPPSGRGTTRTTRARGGRPSMRSNVSKQAPRGMVRITLKEIEPRFVADLTDAINSLPSWERD